MSDLERSLFLPTEYIFEQEPLVWLSQEQRCIHSVLSDPKKLETTCFLYITQPQNFFPGPYWETPLGHMDLILGRLTMGAFIRKRYKKGFRDPRFDIKFKRKRGQQKTDSEKLAELNADLWIAVWNMAEKMYPVEGTHPALWLFGMSRPDKMGLLRFCFHHFSDPDATDRARAVLKKTQGENRILRGREGTLNPFSLSDSPFSFNFAERAIDLSYRLNGGPECWKAIVDARSAITNVIKQDCWKAFNQDGESTGAGRPKKKCRSIAENHS